MTGDPGPTTRMVLAEVEALRSLLKGAAPIVASAARAHLDQIAVEVTLLEEAADRLRSLLDESTDELRDRDAAERL